MKKFLLLSVVICIVFISCSRQNATPSISPSVIPQLSSTEIPQPTNTLLVTVSPTETNTPLPNYSPKQVIFIYEERGYHSNYDYFFYLPSSPSYPNFVIYSDGQLIIIGEKYKQKSLSPDEIEQLLSKLDSLGFYSLESNQQHDQTDTLYSFGNNYERIYDGLRYCISINTDNPKSLCVHEPQMKYVIPKMKNIIQYLDEYEPTELKPYYPDRILVWVESGRDPYNDYLPKDSIPWTSNLPTLETDDSKIMYVDGDAAKNIYMFFFDSVYRSRVFIQNGKEYTVNIKVILPHEQVSNVYQ